MTFTDAFGAAYRVEDNGPFKKLMMKNDINQIHCKNFNKPKSKSLTFNFIDMDSVNNHSISGIEIVTIGLSL